MPRTTNLSPEFREFIVAAKAHAYGSPDAEVLSLASGAKEISFESDGWLYTDSYVGGIPYGGYEHVSARHPLRKNEWTPIWCMTYHGAIENERLSGEMLTHMLGEVLAKPEPALPVRGPRFHMLQNNWGTYRFESKGSLEKFTGAEKIGHDAHPAAYKAEFWGGLVNRIPELEKLKPKWLV